MEVYSILSLGNAAQGLALPRKASETEAAPMEPRVMSPLDRPIRPSRSLIYLEETFNPVSISHRTSSHSAVEGLHFVVAVKRGLASFAEVILVLQLPDT